MTVVMIMYIIIIHIIITTMIIIAIIIISMIIIAIISISIIIIITIICIAISIHITWLTTLHCNWSRIQFPGLDFPNCFGLAALVFAAYRAPSFS